MSRTQKITKRVVDAMKLDEYVWDTEVSGFYVRQTKGGHRSYGLRYRAAGRRQRFCGIGKHGSPWTPETARTKAKQLAGLVAEGKDPALAKAERRATLTVSELAKRYLAEHAEPKKKKRSAEGDKINLRLHVEPEIGKLLLTDVTAADVTRLHAKMRKTPATANRCLALVSKMFSLAEGWGEMPGGASITKRIEKYPERARERFLSDDEVKRLHSAFASHRSLPDGRAKMSPILVSLFEALLLTGARLGELQRAKWSQLDECTKQLVLPDSKTGAKSVPLSDEAMAVLNKLPRLEGNPYVFPGVKAGQPVNGVQKAWQRIRKTAELEDLRIHDLRHSFASAMARDGHGLQVIGAVLGHRHTATTARYSHLLPHAARLAASGAASRLAGAGDLGEGASAQSQSR